MTELWKSISILGESWYFYIHFRPLSVIFQEKVVTLRQKQEYMQNSIIGRKGEIALLKKYESHWQPRRTARPRDSWNSIETLYAKWDWRVFSVFWFPLVTSECVAYLHGSRWRTLLSQSVQSRWKSGTRNRPPVLLWKLRITKRIQKAVCFSIQESRTLSCCHQAAGGKAFGDDSRRDTWTVGRQ